MTDLSSSIVFRNGWNGSLICQKIKMGVVMLAGAITIGETTPGTIVCDLPGSVAPKSLRVSINAYSNVTKKADDVLIINNNNQIEVASVSSAGGSFIGFHIVYMSI